MDMTSYILGRKSQAGGSGGTSNYNDLSNKPSINNTTLSGNKSLNDLGIVNGSSKRLIIVENGSVNTQNNIDVLQAIYNDYTDNKIDFGEVYLKDVSQDYQNDNVYFLLNDIHADSESMVLKFYDTKSSTSVGINAKIININCTINSDEVTYITLTKYDLLSGLGDKDIFYEEATYQNPFIFSGKKKGIYFLKYDNEHAYAKFNAGSSSVVDLTTVLNYRINGIIENAIEITRDVPDNIANDEIFANYLAISNDKNYSDSPFTRIMVARKYSANHGLDFYSSDFGAGGNIQIVKNKTTSINSGSTDTEYPSAKAVWDLPTTYSGYDATKTQVLKNVNGTLTWVDE